MYHEIPVYGGRARGRQRPRAPSFVERPGGQPREFPLRRGSIATASGAGASADQHADTGSQKRT